RFSRDWSSDVCSSDLANGFNLFKDMRRNQDRPPRSQTPDQLAHLMFLVWIQAICRLIQDQYRWLMQHCLGQPHTTVKPFGQGTNQLLAYLAQLQQILNPPDALLQLCTTVATHFSDKSQKIMYFHFGVAGRTFWQIAKHVPGAYRFTHDINTAQACSSGVGCQKARKHFH